MSASPKVSVIIPTKNHAKFLGRCLRSIFSQTMSPRYEVVVFNDGSTDDTPMLLEAFRDDLVVISSESSVGLPAALNAAIAKSSGDYIVRLDSDDFVSRNFLNFLATVLDSNPTINAVACDYLLFNDDDGDFTIIDSRLKPIGCGIMFRRSAFDAIGGYNEEFLWLEEREFRSRFEKKFSVEHIPIPLYRYRRHEANITNDAAAMSHFEEKLAEESKSS